MWHLLLCRTMYMWHLFFWTVSLHVVLVVIHDMTIKMYYKFAFARNGVHTETCNKNEE